MSNNFEANFDKFRPSTIPDGINSIVFGANAPLTEKDLNELQFIQNRNNDYMCDFFLKHKVNPGHGLAIFDDKTCWITGTDNNNSKLPSISGLKVIANCGTITKPEYIFFNIDTNFNNFKKTLVSSLNTEVILYIHIYKKTIGLDTEQVPLNKKLDSNTAEPTWADDRYNQEISRRIFIVYDINTSYYPSENGYEQICLVHFLRLKNVKGKIYYAPGNDFIRDTDKPIEFWFGTEWIKLAMKNLDGSFEKLKTWVRIGDFINVTTASPDTPSEVCRFKVTIVHKQFYKHTPNEITGLKVTFALSIMNKKYARKWSDSISYQVDNTPIDTILTFFGNELYNIFSYSISDFGMTNGVTGNVTFRKLRLFSAQEVCALTTDELYTHINQKRQLEYFKMGTLRDQINNLGYFSLPLISNNSVENIWLNSFKKNVKVDGDYDYTYISQQGIICFDRKCNIARSILCGFDITS